MIYLMNCSKVTHHTWIKLLKSKHSSLIHVMTDEVANIFFLLLHKQQRLLKLFTWIKLKNYFEYIVRIGDSTTHTPPTTPHTLHSE